MCVSVCVFVCVCVSRKMIGSDINQHALHSARTIIERNSLAPKIDLRQVSSVPSCDARTHELIKITIAGVKRGTCPPRCHQR